MDLPPNEERDNDKEQKSTLEQQSETQSNFENNETNDNVDQDNVDQDNDKEYVEDTLENHIDTEEDCENIEKNEIFCQELNNQIETLEYEKTKILYNRKYLDLYKTPEIIKEEMESNRPGLQKHDPKTTRLFDFIIKYLFWNAPIVLCITLLGLSISQKISWWFPVVVIVATTVAYIVAKKKEWILNWGDWKIFNTEKYFVTEKTKFLREKNEFQISNLKKWSSVNLDKNALVDKTKFGFIFGAIRILETCYMVGLAYFLSWVISAFSGNKVVLHANIFFTVAIILIVVWYNSVWVFTYIKMIAKTPTRLKFGIPATPYVQAIVDGIAIFAGEIFDSSQKSDSGWTMLFGGILALLLLVLVFFIMIFFLYLCILAYLIFSAINPNTYSVSGAMSQNYIRHLYFSAYDIKQYDEYVEQEYKFILEVIDESKQRNQDYLDKDRDKMNSDIGMIEVALERLNIDYTTFCT